MHLCQLLPVTAAQKKKLFEVGREELNEAIILFNIFFCSGGRMGMRGRIASVWARGGKVCSFFYVAGQNSQEQPPLFDCWGS